MVVLLIPGLTETDVVTVLDSRKCEVAVSPSAGVMETILEVLFHGCSVVFDALVSVSVFWTAEKLSVEEVDELRKIESIRFEDVGKSSG